MKKFNFRLQRVIDVREIREKDCQRELASSMGELKLQREMLEAQQAESKQGEESLRRALTSRTNAAGLNALNGWRQWKEEEVVMQQQSTEKQAEVVEGKRKALLQASKERKILEKLKEKRMAEHQNEALRKEQNFLDDIGGQHHRVDRGMDAEALEIVDHNH
ncbi:flagellar export protein FliJ [bacterium]|nr:flagellar export protein FliJ [bacterium]MBU1652776.1 flagellar export protein FliJ [bacterium]MBU1881205.1 flagellar export protein FliJ [bacterium]